MIAYEELVKLRKELHQHPELSGKEFNTAQLIITQLKQYLPQAAISRVAQTGVLAWIKGKEQEGETVLFRCELDALPISETNDFEHRSKTEGVSHKCGHDGHMTILIGLAKELQQQPLKKGNILLLFQPAEETGMGAKAVLSDSNFPPIVPNYVVALHNLPNYPLGSIVLKKGAFTAAVKSIVFQLYGKTAHAAEPEHGINPALAIAELLQKAAQFSKNDREDLALITPVHINMGEKAYGVSAGYGEVHFTLRTWTNASMQQLEDKLREEALAIAKNADLKLKINTLEEFPSTHNNSKLVELAESIGKQQNLDIIKSPYPMKWGEDFGAFTSQYSGILFGLGAGENCPALHNPDYDFPDKLLAIGADFMFGIAQALLK